MASVNEYLKKLLYQYDCVVVPDLGAFLTHYQSAVFTEANGLYLPPRKRVAFNEALRFDDGILANYIMLHEPVTREGAQRHISEFVGELRQDVKTAGRFELDGIGTFTQNDEGRLQFVPGLRHNFFGEAYGMSAVSAQLINRQPQLEAALEAVPVTTLSPILVRDEETRLVPYHPARRYWLAAAVVLLVGSLGVVSYLSVINPGQPFQSSVDPANLFRLSASLVERSTDEKAIPKVGIVQKNGPAPVPEARPVAKVAVEPVVGTPPTEPVAKPEVTPAGAGVHVKLEAARAVKPVVVSKMALPVVRHIRTSPHFTVIAGVFSSKRNALRLKRQLRKAGYADAFVIMPARGQKERYKVAAAGSAIREEAVARMAAISELAGSETWLLKN
ncbi:HU domain-containing protein [Spirosoma areae]